MKNVELSDYVEEATINDRFGAQAADVSITLDRWQAESLIQRLGTEFDIDLTEIQE